MILIVFLYILTGAVVAVCDGGVVAASPQILYPDLPLLYQMLFALAKSELSGRIRGSRGRASSICRHHPTF